MRLGEQSASAVVADPQRATQVQAATQAWTGQLIDLGGRNTLLFYRDLKLGTLDLAAGDSVVLAALFEGRTVALSQLVSDEEAFGQARRRARTIRNKARELVEERGIETCFLAIGMATWDNPKGTATPAAPVLLRQATISARGAAEDDFSLTLTGEVEVNPTLLHLLVQDFQVDLNGPELVDLLDEQRGFDPTPLYQRLEKETAAVRGFAIRPRLVVGTFSYAKLPMVTDLQANEDTLISHDVIAAIAGNRAAQEAIRGAGAGEVSERLPDQIPPADEFLVLDADSSQNFAINAVLGGQNVVIKGPPGTGKSQTIANLITTLVARGKRVLFVAEKRAAIAAVLDRLSRRGLADLVMDVHEGTSGRRRIATDLKAALETASRVALPDFRVLHETVANRRTRLNEYAEALHLRRDPFGLSVFEAHTRLVGLQSRFGEAARTGQRLRGQQLAALDGDTARRVAEQLREFAELGGLTLTPDESPWAGATVTSAEQAQVALEAADRLAQQTLPSVSTLLERLLVQTGLRPPMSLTEWRHALGLLDGAAATLKLFAAEVYAGPLAEMVAACASRAWRHQHQAWPGAVNGWSQRRRLRKAARALWRAPHKPSRQQLFEALSAAEAQQRTWAGVSTDGRPPQLPDDLAGAEGAYSQLGLELRALGAFVQTIDFETLPTAQVEVTVQRLAADERTLRKLPRLHALQAEFARLGLDPLISELRARRLPPELAAAAFEWLWLSSILEQVGFADQRIGAFDATSHRRLASEYRAGDNEHIHTTAQRVRRAVAEHVVTVRDQFGDESRLVEHQANLKRRHLPMRQLFQVAPNMLTALKPCWAMSPLVVSQLLPADRQYFDVVVFDEASQVTPADAVPAIMRARQVVVAGDEHQLPPTSFFTAAADDGEAETGLTADGQLDLSLTSGYESILDVLDALLRSYTLRWHYRSHDERLIGFSNAWIYDHLLTTFPGIAGDSCLQHVLVQQMPTAAEQEESVSAEVQRVVQLALDHARTRPEETLGVITMGIKHADRIDLAIRHALSQQPELQPFFDEHRQERFFVKNLERVQGDERDAIILSIGYGKNPAGKLLYRFGPLLTGGGQRRLNVAVTRARSRMTLVSSFAAADMDPGRSSAEGVKLLRSYLQYAESRGANLGDALKEKPPLNPFEIQVRDRLTAAGIPLVAQYGVAGYWIDFAAQHPTKPGRMVLAIEADGASYHSSPTARDRDRLRQEQLERLGWRFHRIWSTNWFTDPNHEIDRACQAYEAAVATGDADTVTTPGWQPEPRDAAAPAAGRPDAGTPTRHAPKPQLPYGLPISNYTHEELVWLIRWIESDTLLRTEEDLLNEVMDELGFQRRGTQIRRAVAAAIADARG
jgi:very-short-patch-repair endonuclease